MSIRLKDTIYNKSNDSDKLDGIDSTSFAKTVKVGNTSYDASSSIVSLPSYPTIPTIPTTLPNPKTLSWSGASSGSYNGSTAASFTIPTVPTKLSQFTDDVVSGKYLPLTGGTLTKSTNSSNLVLKNESYNPYISFQKGNSVLGHIYVNADGVLQYLKQGDDYRTIWHAGNDGSGSGLDADLLDGKHLSDIINGNIASATNATYLKTQHSNSTSWYDEYLLYGKWSTDNSSVCDFKCDNYVVRVDLAKKLNTARKISISGAVTGNASFDGSADITISTTVNHTHNYAGSSSAGGAATSANKLTTARTISLTGSVTGSGNFDGSGNLSIETTTNHSHSYLPLSGGTLSNSATALYINRTTAGTYPHITFTSQGTAIGDIGFGAGSHLVFYDYSDLKWKSVLTEKNYNSFSPTLTGGGASGTWGISITGTASMATVLNATSTSNLNTPSHWTYDNHYVSYDLYNGSASNKPVSQDNANSILTFYKGWHGTSGAYATQIAFPNNEDIYIRKCSYGTWGSWRKLYHSGNFSASGTTWDGGVVNNTITTKATPGMIVQRSGGVPYIRFGSTDGTMYGELGADASGYPVWWYSAGENSAWRTLVTNVAGTAYNSSRWGGYSISVGSSAGSDSNTIYFVV